MYQAAQQTQAHRLGAAREIVMHLERSSLRLKALFSAELGGRASGWPVRSGGLFVVHCAESTYGNKPLLLKHAQLMQAGHPVFEVPRVNNLAVLEFMDVDGLHAHL